MIYCTGLTAQWCPIHGTCACPERENRMGRTMDDSRCPLHSWQSTHPDASDSTPTPSLSPEPAMTVAPEQLAAIPEDHRLLVARWLIDRAGALKPSWLFPEEQVWTARSLLVGAAVDLADPLAEDSTVAHAEETVQRIRRTAPDNS